MGYKKSMNKKVKNFIRSPKIIFDGLEQDFIDKKTFLIALHVKGSLALLYEMLHILSILMKA